jgi:hypothetical protein
LGVSGLLASYMTADPTQTAIAGPNSSNVNVAYNGQVQPTWYLNGPNYQDTPMGNVWALWPSSHTIKGFGTNPGGLMPLLSAAPYNGSVTYFVSWNTAVCPQCNGTTCTFPLAAACQPSVNITVNWTGP